MHFITTSMHKNSHTLFSSCFTWITSTIDLFQITHFCLTLNWSLLHPFFSVCFKRCFTYLIVVPQKGTATPPTPILDMKIEASECFLKHVWHEDETPFGLALCWSLASPGSMVVAHLGAVKHQVRWVVSLFNCANCVYICILLLLACIKTHTLCFLAVSHE
jgi:hypothetical protein